MKTLQELYDQIIADEKLKRAFVAAMKLDDIQAFLEDEGCDATADELAEFIEAKMAEDSSLEMNREELMEVAGGSILTESVGCTKADSCGCSDTCIQDCC